MTRKQRKLKRQILKRQILRAAIFMQLEKINACIGSANEILTNQEKMDLSIKFATFTNQVQAIQ